MPSFWAPPSSLQRCLPRVPCGCSRERDLEALRREHLNEVIANRELLRRLGEHGAATTAGDRASRLLQAARGQSVDDLPVTAASSPTAAQSGELADSPSAAGRQRHAVRSRDYVCVRLGAQNLCDPGLPCAAQLGKLQAQLEEARRELAGTRDELERRREHAASLQREARELAAANADLECVSLRPRAPAPRLLTPARSLPQGRPERRSSRA